MIKKDQNRGKAAFLFKKFKGYVITMEVLFALIAWSQIMVGTVYIITTHTTQKYMTNAFVSSAISASKWGGTYSNLYVVNGRDIDMATQMEDQLKLVTGQDVNINIVATDQSGNTPPDGNSSKVQEGYEKIKIEMRWVDERYKGKGGMGKMFQTDSPKRLKIIIDSIVPPGKLL